MIPELPEPAGLLAHEARLYEREYISSEDAYTDDQMRQYARDYHAAMLGEPFGYFRVEPFGWTDCAETDEGAIALYKIKEEE